MTPELLAMCEMVMERVKLRDAAFKELNGTTEKQFAYDRAVKSWAIAEVQYSKMLRDDIERHG